MSNQGVIGGIYVGIDAQSAGFSSGEAWDRCSSDREEIE